MSRTLSNTSSTSPLTPHPSGNMGLGSLCAAANTRTPKAPVAPETPLLSFLPIRQPSNAGILRSTNRHSSYVSPFQPPTSSLSRAMTGPNPSRDDRTPAAHMDEQGHRDRQRRAALEEFARHFDWAYFVWIPLAAAAVCLVVGIFTFDVTFIVAAAVAGLSALLMWLGIRER